MQRVDSLEKSLMLGGIGGRRRGRQRMRWLMASPTRWTWVWVNSGSWWWTGRPDMLQFMGPQRVGRDWVTELNWTELGVRLAIVSTEVIANRTNSELTESGKKRNVSSVCCYSVTKLCLTLCSPRDGRPPGSTVPGIHQPRTLEWVAIPFCNA